MVNRALEKRAGDIPRIMFNHLNAGMVCAEIVSTEAGIIAGVETLECQAETLGLQATIHVSSGSEVQAGTVVAVVSGNPVQVVRGEDLLLGTIGKVSGVATAAHTAVAKAGRIRVVCGGWKKMPAKMKDELRDAIKLGGVDTRIALVPFLYMDKNYVRILGSLVKALEQARLFPGRTVAVQLRGETGPIGEEAVTAAMYGAQILMIDTGRINDLREVSLALRQKNLRQRVELAFAGNLSLDELERLQGEDVDVVDIGRAILDAPLLDFRYDVFKVEANKDGTAPTGKD